MLARYGSERQFGNTFRRMANTSFSKIQFVAKVSKKCLVLVLLLFLTIEALVVINGGLRSGFHHYYNDPNFRQETELKFSFQYKKQFSPPGTAGIQRSDRSCCSQPDKKIVVILILVASSVAQHEIKAHEDMITSVNSISSIPSPVYQ